MFVGIEVAKAELVISMLPRAERFTAENDEVGVRTLVQRIAAGSSTLIVLDATGGYELLAVAALAAARRLHAETPPGIAAISVGVESSASPADGLR